MKYSEKRVGVASVAQVITKEGVAHTGNTPNDILEPKKGKGEGECFNFGNRLLNQNKMGKAMKEWEVDSDDVQELLDSHNEDMTIDEQDIKELESLDPIQSEAQTTDGNLTEGSGITYTPASRWGARSRGSKA
ncbi:hypothetical protein TNCV_439461 [Trichonephila clavipes]|nr:hypothetical protein TNCV_439461 [Trichonephila clavipes]